MSTRDSTFSYFHIDDPNQVLYMERWKDDPISFDDIDTQALLEETSNLFPQMMLEEDDEEGAIPISSMRLGAKLIKNKELLKEKTWNDLGIFEKFLNEGSALHKEVDRTIIRPLHTKPSAFGREESEELSIGEFLSNGYLASDHMDSILSPDMVNDSIMGVHQGDTSINSTSDMIVPENNTFLNFRSGSIGGSSAQAGSAIQTPRIGRTRQSSTDKNFQTPITRIMR
ncbi:uncharacterized protein CANTADRAFT_25039 [Suhomyces tanzawaensis NRRL Y-17324]|uniref:Uncharacterized protein n=1 Tax=Suhomyces tanzawaensis NRRL Y-17324 TaxID=984487 RepID=A0A1E4SLY0_9ASCO|nr:uncharacterized protein CANTADRAFT_25039 [Suhomyces tanzawaensis NRRL Y-17324]ODV80534.1 hypothetical protein CANTADRAFT_25039 [Suhomyces tanzawaensis NRRL Y-17324]